MGDEFQSTINGQDKSGVNIGDVDGGIHGSDIAGRDVHVYGDQVQGDKVDRDKVNGDKISDDYIRVTIGDNAQNVIVGKDNQIIINSAGTAPLYVNVPTMPNYFLGREKLITSLTQRLVAQQHLALAMEGLPGVGKTTLAVAIVHRVEVIQHFNDGVLWAGLGQQADINGNLASWAEALGLDISDQNTVGERFQAIKAAIGQRRFLIVIDDAWGIEEAHHLRCGGLNCCHILTTRNQDVAQAFAGREQVISVPVLNDDISYQLLQKLAPKACDADAETAQQLVRVVGGLPLALELLGGFLSPSQHSRYAELGSAALSQMLNPQERLQLAAQRLGSMDNPKVSLQATIMLSLEDPSLPQAAVATFYALGAFAPKPAHFDRSAAEAVAETDLVMLAILASRNLLDDAQGLEQLALHQELANVAITQTPPEAVWRHRSYYLDLVNENPEDWQRIELVYGQIKWARLREVSNSPEDENLLDFIWPLGIYQHRRGLWKDSIDWIKRGVKVAQAKNRQDIIELMFGRLGIVYHDIGQNILAIEQFQQALMIARGIGNRQGESSHLGNLGIAYHDLGDEKAAIEKLGPALIIAQEIGNRQSEGSHLGSLGLAYRSLGQHKQAIEQFQQALNIAQEIGDRRCESSHLDSLGLTYHDLGDEETAIEKFQQALIIAKEIGDRRCEERQLGNMGLAYRSLGQYEQAIEQFQQALNIAQEIGDRRGESSHLGSIGLTYHDLGDEETAIEKFQQALIIAKEIEDRRSEERQLGSIGLVYQSLGQNEQAIKKFQQALTIAQEIGDHQGECSHLDSMGFTYHELGQFEKAISMYENSLTIKQELSDRHAEGQTLTNLGIVYRQQGEQQKALVACKEALTKLHPDSPEYKNLLEWLQKPDWLTLANNEHLLSDFGHAKGKT